MAATHPEVRRQPVRVAREPSGAAISRRQGATQSLPVVGHPFPVQLTFVLHLWFHVHKVARPPVACGKNTTGPRSIVGPRPPEGLGALRRPEGEHIPEDAVGQAEAGLENGVRRFLGAPTDRQRPQPQDLLPLEQVSAVPLVRYQFLAREKCLV